MQVNPWNIIRLLRNEVSDLRFQIKILRDKVAAFESGEKYIQMKNSMLENTRYYERLVKELKNELADAHKETVEVRELWNQICEDILRETAVTLEEMQKEVEKAQKKQYEAERERDKALDKAREKNAEMYAAKAALEEEKEKNNALTARINKDHTNSSKPSSTNPNHPTIHNSREKSGRKPGAQEGHEFHPRKRLTPSETIIIPAPDQYVNNPNFKFTGKVIRKQVIGLKVILEVKEYVTPEYRNQTTGQRVHSVFPEGMKDDVIYDGTVKAMAYMLNNYCNVSIDKTSCFIRDITGGKLNISNGTICNLAKEFSVKTQTERDEIFLDLFTAPVLHTDFTFGRTNGKTSAVIICATPDGKVLYQARETKGKEGVKGSPVEFYEGTVVSDHESVLADKGTKHQECLTHIERYARSAQENEPSRQWPPLLLKWVQEAIHFWNERNAGRETEDGKPEEFISELHKILDSAKEEYLDVPAPLYFSDGINTVKRMIEKPEDYTLFLLDPSVPPTNNMAERCGRKYKRKSHQVISFRSFQGSAYYCDGLTIIENLRSQNLDLFKEIAERFS